MNGGNASIARSGEDRSLSFLSVLPDVAIQPILLDLAISLPRQRLFPATRQSVFLVVGERQEQQVDFSQYFAIVGISEVGHQLGVDVRSCGKLFTGLR